MSSKQDRVAIVTGAANGIGKAVAEQLVSEGRTVVLLDRDEAPLRALTSELTGPGKAEPEVVDLAVEKQILDAMSRIKSRHQNIDILVNNAGIHPKKDGGKCPLPEIDSAHWAQVIAVNLTAPFLLCREVLPLMQRNRWGRIINVSSRAGRAPSPLSSASYSASKAGIIGLTRVIAVEGAPYGVTANVVAPGPVETSLTLQSSPETRQKLTSGVPLGRYGQPEELAAFICFVSSDAASYATGAIFDVNGGTLMP